MSNLRVVSLGTLLSRVVGLARDVGMAALFGAGTTLDAFIVAFRLPNLTRQMFGEGALTTAFLPVFIKDREQNGDAAARATLSAVAVVLLIILTSIVIVMEVVSLVIWKSVALSPSTLMLLQLFMIFLPYMVFICLAALFCAALHSMRQFLWPALVPVVLNVFWMLGVVLAWYFAKEDLSRARIVAVAITGAGALQMLLPLIVLQRSGMGLVRSWKTGWPRVGVVFRTMLPVVAGVSIMQINAVMDSFMAWGLSQPDQGGHAWCEQIGIPPLLEAGTATALYIGQRMYQFPLGVFGVALGTVLFPVLTHHAQRGETALLKADIARGLRLVIAVGLPASAGLFLLAGPITSLLFRHGQFSAEDAALTASMIATYGLGVWCYIGLIIMNRVFYATDDRISPMRLGLITLVANLIFNVFLVWTFGGIGLALGSVLSALLQVILTGRQLNKNLGELDWHSIYQTGWKGLSATLLMSAIMVATLSLMPTSETMLWRFLHLVAPFATGTLTYFVAAHLLQIKELSDFIGRRD